MARLTTGRKVGKRCRPVTRSNRRKKHCTLVTPVRGSFRHRAAAGSNSFTFTGRLGGKSLKPGSYRLTAVARDPAGNVSRALTKPFTIVR